MLTNNSISKNHTFHVQVDGGIIKRSPGSSEFGGPINPAGLLKVIYPLVSKLILQTTITSPVDRTMLINTG